jgi:hypothetical protein
MALFQYEIEVEIDKQSAKQRSIQSSIVRVSDSLTHKRCNSDNVFSRCCTRLDSAIIL